MLAGTGRFMQGVRGGGGRLEWRQGWAIFLVGEDEMRGVSGLGGDGIGGGSACHSLVPSSPMQLLGFASAK